MDRRKFLAGAAAIAGGAVAKPALAQNATEISFFYPVAVGGPITRIIDGYAAEFEKTNPDVKVKPIYAGTYQETIVKALTAHKSGTPPVTSVLLSTDMFTLIDEDAIVPFDGFIKTDDYKKWLASFFPAFMENSQTGGKTWGIPFQRSTIVLYWNKEAFKDAGLDPEKPPATWADLLEVCRSLKAEGIEPFAIGSKDLWPTAAWFDYLDLRTNGYAFHMALTRGDVPYTDERVRMVFDSS